MALAEIYWFLHADQDRTAAQINDEYPEMILQKSFVKITTDKLDGKIALTIILGYCTFIYFYSKYFPIDLIYLYICYSLCTQSKFIIKFYSDM